MNPIYQKQNEELARMLSREADTSCFDLPCDQYGPLSLHAPGGLIAHTARRMRAFDEPKRKARKK